MNRPKAASAALNKSVRDHQTNSSGAQQVLAVSAELRAVFFPAPQVLPFLQRQAQPFAVRAPQWKKPSLYGIPPLSHPEKTASQKELAGALAF